VCVCIKEVRNPLQVRLDRYRCITYIQVGRIWNKSELKAYIQEIPTNTTQLQKHIPTTKYTITDIIIYMKTLLIIP